MSSTSELSGCHVPEHIVGARCQDGRMAQRRGAGSRDDTTAGRPIDVDDLPDPMPRIVLVVGEEELLVTRAVAAVAAAMRRASPDVVETERAGSDIEGPELHELLGASLFGDARLVVVRSAQDLRTAAQGVLAPYLESPADGCTVVLQHAGGAKGKAVLASARAHGAGEITCARLTRAGE